MNKDLDLKPIYVRLGNLAQQLGISKRSLERFISRRKGIVPGRYQMPDNKSFIYNAAEFIKYFNNQLRSPVQLTKLLERNPGKYLSAHKLTNERINAHVR